MNYIRTFGLKEDGYKQRTHLDGISDSSTLCGFDTAGDSLVHGKPPQFLIGKRTVTCEQCQDIISTVKEHLNL